MRKCRIYDKHLKIIRDVKYIDFTNEEVMYYADEFEGNEDKANLDIVRGFNEVNIMWSTGIKDKKGVDIYEGDIVWWQLRDRVNEELVDGIFKVKWDEERMQWISESRDEGLPLSDDVNDKNTMLMVIGNIYEDQECRN